MYWILEKLIVFILNLSNYWHVLCKTLYSHHVKKCHLYIVTPRTAAFTETSF